MNSLFKPTSSVASAQPLVVKNSLTPVLPKTSQRDCRTQYRYYHREHDGLADLQCHHRFLKQIVKVKSHYFYVDGIHCFSRKCGIALFLLGCMSVCFSKFRLTLNNWNSLISHLHQMFFIKYILLQCLSNVDHANQTFFLGIKNVLLPEFSLCTKLQKCNIRICPLHIFTLL